MASVASAHINVLLGETVGRVFAWNVVDHVETDHLLEDLFAKAWSHYVKRTATPPRDADGVIAGIQKWPGEPGHSYVGRPAWFQGRKSPPELRAWMNEKLFNVSLTERVTARKDANAIVARLPRASNPLSTAPPFVAWLSSPVPDRAVTSNDLRDLLGLVHRDVEKGSDLTVLEYGPGRFSMLARPTPLDSGANTRFCAVSEEEWASRNGATPYPDKMGKAAHLAYVRRKDRPITHAHEAVSVAGADFIDRCSDDWHLGPVTISGAADAAVDSDYEKFLVRGRAHGIVEDFLEQAYRP